MRGKGGGPLLFVRRADSSNRSAGSMHLHRVTRDIQAHRSSHAVRFPLRHVAVAITPDDEAVLVAAMTTVLAAAVAGDVTQHLWVLGGESIGIPNDFDGPCRRHRHEGQRGKARLRMRLEVGGLELGGNLPDQCSRGRRRRRRFGGSALLGRSAEREEYQHPQQRHQPSRNQTDGSAGGRPLALAALSGRLAVLRLGSGFPAHVVHLLYSPLPFWYASYAGKRLKLARVATSVDLDSLNAARPTRARAYAAWVVVCIVWGTTYLGIRIALETIPPMLMAAMRWTVAGSLLLAGLKWRGEHLPRPRAWPSLALLGILLLGFGNGGVVWAELTVPSGLTAVLVATVPFWMVGFEALTRYGDKATVRHAIALVTGFSGILILVWPDIGVGENRGVLGGIVATQIAAAGWGLGSAYARHRGRTEASAESVLGAAGFEMLFGGLALLALGLVLGEHQHLMFSARSTGALVYLILAGSIAGFTAFAYAIRHLPVAIASLYAYVNPVIAVGLGTALLGEPFGLRTALGAAIVFAGVALTRDPPKRPAGR